MKHIAIAILSGALLISPAFAACPDGWTCNKYGDFQDIRSAPLVNTYPALNDIGSPTWSPATKDDIDNLNKRLDAIEKLIRSMREERR
jgi:hypothetical protein